VLSISIAPGLTIAAVVIVPAFIVKSPMGIVPLAVYPVPLRVIDWPGTAVAGVTVIERNPINKSNVADLVGTPPAISLTTILWVPAPMLAGILNLSGFNVVVLPPGWSAVAPAVITLGVEKALRAVPLIVIAVFESETPVVPVV